MCSNVFSASLPHRVHRDLGEQAFARLREDDDGDARDAVEQRRQDRRPDQPGQRLRLPPAARRVAATSPSVAHL